MKVRSIERYKKFEIFHHCRCVSDVIQNQDCIISVVCNMYVFRNFFDAKLWKTIPRIRFSTYFWPPEKIIDGIMTVFPKKKWELHVWWHGKGLPPCDFWIFFNAKLWKTIRRIRFSTYFWPPEKIDEIIGVIFTIFFFCKNGHISVNLFGGQK